MVEFIVAIDEARVRFTDDALFLSFSFFRILTLTVMSCLRLLHTFFTLDILRSALYILISVRSGYALAVFKIYSQAQLSTTQCLPKSLNITLQLLRLSSPVPTLHNL